MLRSPVSLCLRLLPIHSCCIPPAQQKIEQAEGASDKLIEELGVLGKRLQAEEQARATVENQFHETEQAAAVLASEVEARRKVEADAAAAKARAEEERFAEASKGGKAVFGSAEVGAWFGGWFSSAARHMELLPAPDGPKKRRPRLSRDTKPACRRTQPAL